MAQAGIDHNARVVLIVLFDSVLHSAPEAGRQGDRVIILMLLILGRRERVMR